MKVAGIFNTDPWFTHGQFYIAFSHVSLGKIFNVYAPDHETNNIIYEEKLELIKI